jgi:hypothetical protein
MGLIGCLPGRAWLAPGSQAGKGQVECMQEGRDWFPSQLSQVLGRWCLIAWLYTDLKWEIQY